MNVPWLVNPVFEAARCVIAAVEQIVDLAQNLESPLRS